MARAGPDRLVDALAAPLLDGIRSPTWDPRPGFRDLRLAPAVAGALVPALTAAGLVARDVVLRHPWSREEHQLTVVDGSATPLYLVQVDQRLVDRPMAENIDVLNRLPALVPSPATIRVFGHPAGPHLAIRTMTDSWRVEGLDVDYVTDRTVNDFAESDRDAASLWALLRIAPPRQPAGALAPPWPPPGGGGAPPARHRLFVSYAREDAATLERVLAHLAAVTVDDVPVDPWTDEQIRAGDAWAPEIQEALDASTGALLLVSADFFASRFISEQELPRILDARGRGLVVFWVKCRPVRVPRAFADIQALHADPPLGRLRGDAREDALATAMERLVDRLMDR